MPCRMDDMDLYQTQLDREAATRKMNELTAKNDLYREALLAITERYGDAVADLLPKNFIRTVKAEQTKHRKQDLARLEKTFTELRDAEKLAKVWAADPKKPLEPQLGFSPDAF